MYNCVLITKEPSRLTRWVIWKKKLSDIGGMSLKTRCALEPAPGVLISKTLSVLESDSGRGQICTCKRKWLFIQCTVIFMEWESELFIVLALAKISAKCESAADATVAFCGWLPWLGCVCMCAHDYASSWRVLDDILRLWQRKHAGQQLTICDADDIEKLKSVDLDGERASFFTFLFADVLQQHNLNNQPTTLHRYWSMLSEQMSRSKLRHVRTFILL